MSDIDQLRAIMARLRDPVTGCPWDRVQSFTSIAPYTIEEAYEVVDAITRGDLNDLREELGDLLFQVVFQSRLAEEAGAFTFDQVVAAICTKMIRRHPHLFGSGLVDPAAGHSQQWEQHKQRERAAKAQSQGQGQGQPVSVLADVPLNLPALLRAAKLGKRAASVGFEWPDVSGALDKLSEEIAELRAAIAAPEPTEQIAAELGDVLFCVVNISRHLQVNAEAALQATNQKFERRFRHVEQRLQAQQRDIHTATLAEMDAYWDEAKRLERAAAEEPQQS